MAQITEDDGHRVQATGELFDARGKLVARGTGYFARSKLALTPEVQYR